METLERHQKNTLKHNEETYYTIMNLPKPRPPTPGPSRPSPCPRPSTLPSQPPGHPSCQEASTSQTFGTTSAWPRRTPRWCKQRSRHGRKMDPTHACSHCLYNVFAPLACTLPCLYQLASLFVFALYNPTCESANP